MKFAIIDGLPYLISGGMAIPVKIDGDRIQISKAQATATNEMGRYSLPEIKAKCKTLNSIKTVKRRKAVEE